MVLLAASARYPTVSVHRAEHLPLCTHRPTVSRVYRTCHPTTVLGLPRVPIVRIATFSVSAVADAPAPLSRTGENDTREE